MKTLTLRIALIAIIASLHPFRTSAAEALSVLLQKGIYAEETEGNLDAAIRIYSQIAREAATSRTLIAQAQYRLGVCYQKQGSKDTAVATFSELISQFPMETVLLQKARAQLVALGHSAPEAVTLRKVAVVDNYWFRGVSPNGRYVAYMGKNGEMYIQDHAAGKIWEPFKCNWSKQPYGFLFSPDSNRIAYDTYGNGVFVANVDGSDTRQIHRPDNGATIELGVWLAKSGKLLAARKEAANGAKSLVSLDPESGVLERVNTPPWSSRFWYPSLNGRYIAMLQGGRLSVVDVASGRQQTIVNSHATRGLVGWARDDTELYFCSDRSGNRSLCVVEMRAGSPLGQPKVIKEETAGLVCEYVTPEGHIYYSEKNNTGNICVASVNFETGEVKDGPRLATSRFPGQQTNPAWSKDGGRLWLAVEGNQGRYLSVSMPSGNHEDFVFPLNFRSWSFSLSPDSNFVVLQGINYPTPGSRESTRGVHRYDLATRKVETLADDSDGGRWYRSPRIAPDGKSFYYTREISPAILRRNLVTGKLEFEYEFAGERGAVWQFQSLAPSPDGSRLAIVSSDESKNEEFVVAIEMLDLATRQRRDLLRLSPREYVTSLDWTPDGKRIVYTKSMPPGGAGQPRQTAIWSTAVESGQPVRLDIALPKMGDIAVSPNGHQIAFRTGTVGDTVQLWVMEGAQPIPPAPGELVGPTQPGRSGQL